MVYILLAVGILLLIKGADTLIGSSSRLAKILGVPSFIIGLSVIAFGTSAPEAAVGIFSGIRGANELTMGDVIGSSIVNIVVVIGITAIILPVRVEKIIALREIPISFGIQIVLCIMLLWDGVLSRLDALVLLLIFALFLHYLVKKTRTVLERTAKEACGENAVCEDELEEELEEILEKEEVLASDIEETAADRDEIPKLVVMSILGVISLIVGANLIVDSAVNIAHWVGVSEEFIGLTVIAIGTSLPELVTSIMAIMKKEDELAVGNIIGSNIFNIAFVLGISSLINPIPISAEMLMDLAFMCIATLIIFIPSLIFEKVSRRIGFVFISYYVIFIAYKIAQL
jgi:cation:H+ antiporter